MHRSMSFRALVLVGVLVALATAFSQSTQPLAALAVTVGLTPHQHSVLKRARSRPFEFDAVSCSLGRVSLCATHTHRRVAVLILQSPHALAYLLANRSFSDGAAEMAPKAVSSWSNALDGPGLFDIDAPDDGQCGLLDVGAPSADDQGKPFATNDNRCAPDESVVASPGAFELTEPVRTDISPLH